MDRQRCIAYFKTNMQIGRSCCICLEACVMTLWILLESSAEFWCVIAFCALSNLYLVKFTSLLPLTTYSVLHCQMYGWR